VETQPIRTDTPPPTPEPSRPAPRRLAPVVNPSPAAPRPAGEQATIGKGLFIKGEITGSESLFIDGKVEGSINLPGNRVTVGRNGQVAASITAREIVILGKVRGNVPPPTAWTSAPKGADRRRDRGPHQHRRWRLLQGRHRHAGGMFFGVLDFCHRC
jgi:hypothetical protein